MSTYYANDKYNAVLTAGYSVGQTTLYVSAVPNNVPTVIVAAKGTDKETVFAVTDKTTNSLTGVSRLRGANVDLDAQTPLTCLNNEEFINQSAAVDAIFYEEHDETGKHTTDAINEKTEDAGVTVDGLKIKDGRIAGWDGWSELTTLTRATDTTATLSGDWTDRLQKGDKLWWKSDGVSRYNYIIAISYSAPNTTITITAGYVSTANDSRFESGQTITEPRYSKVENPQGFPDWFNFDPARELYGGSGNTTPTYTANDVSMFTIKGMTLYFKIIWNNASGGTAGAGTGQITLTLPVAMSDFVGWRGTLGFGISYEESGTMCGVMLGHSYQSNKTNFVKATDLSTIVGNDQSSAKRYISAKGFYEIA